MNISNKLATILPLLPRLAEDIISPVPQYVSRPSAYEPDYGERAGIQTFTRGLKATLQEVEEALTVLQESIEFIQTQKERHKRSLDVHTSLLAPVNRLPFDLLSRIFLNVHDFNLDDFYLNLSKHIAYTDQVVKDCPSSPAVTVACVNHQWMQVALDTPTLWSTIVFSAANLHFKRQLLKASHQLNKSGRSPLTWIIVDDIWVANEGRDRPWFQSSPLSLFSLLLPHTNRVCSLQIYGDFTSLLREFRAQKASFNSLKSFNFDLPDHMQTARRPAFFRPLEPLLLLDTARITSVTLPAIAHVDHFIFDWNSLQSFVGKLSEQQLYRLFQAPSLRRCRIMGMDDVTLNSALSNSPASRSLICLWFDFDGYGYGVDTPVLPFHQLGHLPLLHTLIIGKPGNVDKDALLDFLRLSSSSLQFLSLWITPLPSISFVHQCLLLTQNLQRFDCYPMNEGSIIDVCEMLAQEPIVPNLRELFLVHIRCPVPQGTVETRSDTPTFRQSLGIVRVTYNYALEDALLRIIKQYLPGADVRYMTLRDGSHVDLRFDYPTYPGAEDCRNYLK